MPVQPSKKNCSVKVKHASKESINKKKKRMKKEKKKREGTSIYMARRSNGYQMLKLISMPRKIQEIVTRMSLGLMKFKCLKNSKTLYKTQKVTNLIFHAHLINHLSLWTYLKV